MKKKNSVGRPAGSGVYKKRFTLYLSKKEEDSVNTILKLQNRTGSSQNISDIIRFAVNKTADELVKTGK
jgi:hypothetical protein